LYLTAALVAAVVVFSLATLPPKRLVLPAVPDATIPGIIHIHTNRSDGLSPPDAIAAAAARAGLKFLVFTDHGDATRTPDPPAYRSGVLCLDGVEISTNGGHYIALDMPAAPYPLGGEARDVVEDVRRLGGFGIAAHPDSPKLQLRWIDWTAAIDGVELLNPDTSWRVIASQPGWRSRGRLAAALLKYPFRAPEVMASLLQPTSAVDQWAAVARQRRVVITAGADAHAKLELRNSDPGDDRFALPLPGYEASFRMMSVHVRPERPLSGNATEDAAILARAIRNGHLYTAVDGIASPPSFEFTASLPGGAVEQGDSVVGGGAFELRVRSNAPPEFTTVVHEGTRSISTVRDANDLVVHAHGPGVYWVEILSNHGSPPVTWIRSNPIYIRETRGTSGAPAPAADSSSARAVSPPGASSKPLFDSESMAGWRVEHDPNSAGAVDLTRGLAGPELRFRFGLAGGNGLGQVTSLVYDLPDGAAPYRRLGFSIRAERPMRISIQVRDTIADRWQRSVYIDATQQERSVAFDDLLPVGVTHVAMPPPASLRSVMFVVDTANTKPGTSGRIWIGNVALRP